MNNIDYEPPNDKNFDDMKTGEFGIIVLGEQWVGGAIMRTSSGCTFLNDGMTVGVNAPLLRTTVVRILDKVTIKRE